MAAGDKYIDCNNSKKELGAEQLFRLLVYDDGTGNPVLHTSQEGTDLEPYFNCTKRKNMSWSQVFRDMILIDDDGNPYLNTTSSET